jgi:hypothetical protein
VPSSGNPDRVRGSNNGLRLCKNLNSYSRSLRFKSIDISISDIESSLRAAGVAAAVAVLENRRA